jgi:hypothetical protein
MIIAIKPEIIVKRPVPVPLLAVQILHEIPWDGVRTAVSVSCK